MFKFMKRYVERIAKDVFEDIINDDVQRRINSVEDTFREDVDILESRVCDNEYNLEECVQHEKVQDMEWELENKFKEISDEIAIIDHKIAKIAKQLQIKKEIKKEGVE